MEKENTRYYNEDEIQYEFDSLNDSKQVDVLYNALGLMRSCNAYSEIKVIAYSMGFKNDKGSSDTYYKSKEQ